MNYFAGTFYFLALLNPRDRASAKAVAFVPRSNDLLFTTEWVLTELADGLCQARNKPISATLYARLIIRPNVRIIHADHNLFDSGRALFESRLDKDWSLTDCTSFVVMRDQGITEALTADRHFDQAGFVALLK